MVGGGTVFHLLLLLVLLLLPPQNQAHGSDADYNNQHFISG
jgi:hypothetical protein